MVEVSKVQLDYLIVGQGIAGSLLALNLLERGRSVLVVDDGHKHAASKVAAGLINPITGRRHALTWRFLEFWEFLQSDYERWEALLEEQFFFRKPILRFFKNREEQELFEKKLNGAEFKGIEIDFPASLDDVPFCKFEEPCYRLEQTGYVDQALFISTVRRYLGMRSAICEDTWRDEDVSHEPGVVRWKNVSAKDVIFTQGFKASRNSFFGELPFRHARGEIVELEGPDRQSSPVLNRGKWLLPTGTGSFKAGATYDLKCLDQNLTEQGLAEIQNAIGDMVDGDFKVQSAASGVRPALHDFKPVLGKHPWSPEFVIFNGLGSKGSLQAPLLVKELVEHLEDGNPLHPQCDVDRFRKYL